MRNLSLSMSLTHVRVFCEHSKIFTSPKLNRFYDPHLFLVHEKFLKYFLKIIYFKVWIFSWEIKNNDRILKINYSASEYCHSKLLAERNLKGTDFVISRDLQLEELHIQFTKVVFRETFIRETLKKMLSWSILIKK